MNRFALLLICALGATSIGASNGEHIDQTFVMPASTPEVVGQALEDTLRKTMGTLTYQSFSYDYLLGKWFVVVTSSMYSKDTEFTYVIDDKHPEEIELQQKL